MTKSTKLADVCVGPNQTLSEVLRCLDRSGKGIALVVDGDNRLCCTVTDGDLRRALLRGLSLSVSLKEWMKQIENELNVKSPVTAPVGTDRAQLLRLMSQESVRHIPLLDEQNRVADLACLTDLVDGTGPSKSGFRAVVMAGGQGERLRPLTGSVPKPMLPLGDRPIMEHLITQLRDSGVRQVSIATHYKSQSIVQHFGDGRAFGVEIEYLEEDHPLGTAGAIGLMSPPDETLLVINGDILTNIDFSALALFHREHRAARTVAVRKYEMNVPYGVVEPEGPYIRGLVEKPSHSFFVNAGIYLLEPEVCPLIPKDQRIDMTDLIDRLLLQHKSVVAFPVFEYWLDIGQPDDYQKALADVASLRQKT